MAQLIIKKKKSGEVIIEDEKNLLSKYIIKENDDKYKHCFNKSSKDLFGAFTIAASEKRVLYYVNTKKAKVEEVIITTKNTNSNCIAIYLKDSPAVYEMKRPGTLYTNKKEARAALSAFSNTKNEENASTSTADNQTTEKKNGFVTLAEELFDELVENTTKKAKEFSKKTKEQMTSAMGLDDAEKKEETDARIDSIRTRFNHIADNIKKSNQEIAQIGREMKDLFKLIGKK